MGKNRDRESLIRVISNVLVHEIIARHTNKPESASFTESEIIEYRSLAEKTAEGYNWNEEDKKHAEEKALKFAKDKLAVKYSDISYSENELRAGLKELIKEMM